MGVAPNHPSHGFGDWETTFDFLCGGTWGTTSLLTCTCCCSMSCRCRVSCRWMFRDMSSGCPQIFCPQGSLQREGSDGHTIADCCGNPCSRSAKKHVFRSRIAHQVCGLWNDWSAWLIESIVTVSACNMNDSPMRSDDRIWPCCAMLRWCCHFLR